MSAKSIIICAHCGGNTAKENTAIRRAEKQGRRLFCDLKCSGLSRRSNKTDAEKRAEKAEYDRLYREKNAASLKAKKAAWFQKSYDPERARIARQKTMARHVEYCRQPEYKAKKQKYDREYRAKKSFGPFWQSSLILQEIQAECLSRQSRYEMDYENGTLNKSQNRRREYVRQTNGC